MRIFVGTTKRTLSEVTQRQIQATPITCWIGGKATINPFADVYHRMFNRLFAIDNDHLHAEIIGMEPIPFQCSLLTADQNDVQLQIFSNSTLIPTFDFSPSGNVPHIDKILDVVTGENGHILRKWSDVFAPLMSENRAYA